MGDRSIDILLGHERVSEDDVRVGFIRLNFQGFFALPYRFIGVSFL